MAEGELERTGQGDHHGFMWSAAHRIMGGDTIFGVLEPIDKLTGAARWDWLLKGTLAFRSAEMKVKVPIAFEVDAQTPPPYTIRLPATGDILFLVPDPKALSPAVRDVLLEEMYDVPWIVDYADDLDALPEQERSRIAFVRVRRDQRPSPAETARVLARVWSWRWTPVPWEVADEEEFGDLAFFGVKVCQGPEPARPAHEVFPWGEVNLNPFE